MSKRSRRSRSEWLTLVRAWRRSKLTAAEFAERRKLDPRQLRWWSWRLGAEAEPTDGPLAFLELPAGPSPAPGELLELTTTNGRVLRFPADLEPERLAGLLAAIEGGR